MARIELISSPYAGKSVIASGQECVNLYAEENKTDPQAPAKVTYYPFPGTLLYSENTEYVFPARGAYRTSRGTAYYVVGQNVYFVGADKTLTIIGVIADRPSRVYMKDNGLVVILVDGTNGYVIDMISNVFLPIIDPNFYGADFVELLDTFFIFNRPGTNQFYITASNASYGMMTNTAIATGSLVASGAAYTNGTYNNVPLTGGTGVGATANITITGGGVSAVTLVDGGRGYAPGQILGVNAASVGGTGAGMGWQVATMENAFDPLDIAAKAGFNDPIVGILTAHRELWLIGNLTTEVWIGTGAADFYFQQVQGAYINHGSAAKYSIASQDILTFFLQQDMQGNGLVLKGQGYDVTEISTPRIVSEFKSYPTIEDAIGFCFQIADHAFYALVFPTANKGWVYDLGNGQWSEWNWTDKNGNLNRPRPNCCMFAFGLILAGDWQTGSLLEININTFTDYKNGEFTGNNGPITRIRTFPHLVDNNQRVTTNSFDADMQVGASLNQADDPQIMLSISNDKGVTYGNPLVQSFGKTGEYLTTVSWNRLGQGRDQVFKLQWSTDANTALNGGFIERKAART